ncbi:MAG TPA: hypothetical protein H9796_06380 [Candidatus Butyricimonas faecavium]|nr:hypothetical protein [Candidatus Butyricimonas faecavium]
MAEMKSDLASELHGKIGDKLYRTLATGKILVTPPSKEPTFVDEKDRDDRDTRMKGYGGSGHFASVVNDAIKIGFPREKRGEQPLGKFMQYNAKTLCKSAKNEKGELVRVYDFKKMVVAAGNLLRANVTVAFDKATGVFTFTQEADSRGGTRANPNDRVYALIIDGVNEDAEFMLLRERSESGGTSFSVPEWWDKENLFVYVFAGTRTKKKASPSICLYPAE